MSAGIGLFSIVFYRILNVNRNIIHYPIGSSIKGYHLIVDPSYNRSLIKGIISSSILVLVGLMLIECDAVADPI